MDELDECWLYVDHNYHSLTNTQENVLLTENFIQKKLLDRWYCPSCVEWHSYRFETKNLILKSCPNTDEPWIKVSDEERVERWWNVPALSFKLTKMNCLTQYAEKPNSPLIKTVGRYNNKLVCLTAFNSQRQIENNWLLISDHTEIININPLFIEKSLEQHLLTRNINIITINSIVDKNFVIKQESSTEEVDLRLNTEAKIAYWHNQNIELAPREFKTLYIFCCQPSGLTKAKFESFQGDNSYPSETMGLIETGCLNESINQLNKTLKKITGESNRFLGYDRKTKLYKILRAFSFKTE